MTINELIKEKRLELNLTYEQLGNLVGVGKSTVRKWEMGIIKNMKKDNIIALAKAFNINPLLLISDNKYPSERNLKHDSIGERIKNRRKELGLSVEYIANKLNKNKATIYRYENNDIENLPVSILEPLSILLKTTPDFLLGYNTAQMKRNSKTNSSIVDLNLLLNQLLEVGIITDIDNMDKDTEDMILSLIKRELKKIKEENK